MTPDSTLTPSSTAAIAMKPSISPAPAFAA
jgi:hypothetical protein